MPDALSDVSSETSAAAFPHQGRALVFTQQLVGLGGRKTSLVFMAESLAAQGWSVSVVTVQLSRLSLLRGNARLGAAPRDIWNRWRRVSPTLESMVWIPAFHPARWPSRFLNLLSTPLLHAYGALLPQSVIRRAREADLIVIESCAAVALFRRLRCLAPRAKIVHSMSDRLDVVGMHPGLAGMFRKDAPAYDLIRVPADALLADAPNARTAVIPHGLDKAAYDLSAENPLPTGRHAVLAGDMMFDQPAFERLVRAFPDVTFHAFGRFDLGAVADAANVRAHGEVPFAALAAYLRHADVGLALYKVAPGLEYIAQSSLKLIQYEYCGLPTVAPHFAAGDHGNVFGYDPDDADSLRSAFADALASPRIEGGQDVRDWDEMVRALLSATFRSEAAA